MNNPKDHPLSSLRPVGLETVSDPETALLLDAKKGITSEEARILGELRRIRSRVLPLKAEIRRLKARLTQPSPGPLERAGQDDVQALAELEARLETLRSEWNDWIARRDEARHRRMVILGHEEP